VNPHAVPSQVAVAFARGAQGVQAAPQLATLALLTQAPSQRCAPASHVTSHAPIAQRATPPAGAAQAMPHAPQCAALVLVSTSQPLAGLPSQSAKPASQRSAQAPIAQVAAALGPATQGAQRSPQVSTAVSDTQRSPQR